MIDKSLLDDQAELNRVKSAHLLEALRKAKISLIVDGGEIQISHNGGEYEAIGKNTKQIGFEIEED